jgi:hypothetical protein
MNSFVDILKHYLETRKLTVKQKEALTRFCEWLDERIENDKS